MENYEESTTPNLPNLRIRLIREGPSSSDIIVKRPNDISPCLMDALMDLDRECLAVIPMDSKNRVLGIHIAAIGSSNTCPVSVGNIYKVAILSSATSVIIAHNHPSGETEESESDIQVTRAAFIGGEILGIDLLDHIIIGHNRSKSIRSARPDLFVRQNHSAYMAAD